MGGWGSGAPKLWQRVEAMRCLNIDRLQGVIRAARPADGEEALPLEAELRWPDGMSVRLKVCHGGSEPTLTLSWSTHQQTVHLWSRLTPSGGRFWVAWCPVTDILVRRLYLAERAGLWAGRQALHLKHQSTVESPLDRALRRVRKLEARLAARGCAQTEDSGEALRPRHRRRDWLERVQAQLDGASERVNRAWLPVVQGLLRLE